MAKQLYDREIDMSTPWDGDSSTNNCPVKGTRVEEFLKKKLRENAEAVGQKIGWFTLTNNPDTSDGQVILSGYKSEEDYLGGSEPVTSVTFYSQRAEDKYVMACRVTKIPDLAMAKGTQNVLKYTYACYLSSDRSQIDPENGSAKVTINGVEVEALGSTLLPDGNREYEIDLGPYLLSETNTVRLTVTNQHEGRREWTYTIHAYEINLSADSMQENLVRTGPWDLQVKCTGIESTVHCRIDGVEVATTTIGGATTTKALRIDPNGSMSAGAHKIELWANNASYGITSNVIRKSFIKAGAPSVAVGGDAPTQVQYYDTAIIPYFCYLPNHAGQSVEVVMRISGTEVARQIVAVNLDGSTDMHSFSLSVTNPEWKGLESLQVTILAADSAASNTHTFSIVASDVDLEAAGAYKLLLSASGLTNSDSAAENWKAYDSEGSVAASVVRSQGFALQNGGFGEDGMYTIPAGNYIELNGYLPFQADRGANGNLKTGLTIEVEFEAVNCTNNSALIASCLDSGVGFELYADRAVLHYGQGKSIESPYGDERRIRFGMTVDGSPTTCVNKVIGQEDEVSERNLLMMYINGVVVRMDEYGSQAMRHNSPKPIRIGSENADVRISSVRIYESALGFKQMINNWAYDTPDVEQKLAIARRNDVLSGSGEVDFAKVRTALPDTPYVIWDMAAMPQDKKTNVECDTYFTNPRAADDDDCQQSFECLSHGQVLDGTSSMGYPDPYKNFGSNYGKSMNNARYAWRLRIGDELVTITKYTLTSGLGEGVGETEFVHKVNFASSEGVGNILAMNAYQKILLGTAQHQPDVLTPQQAQQQAVGHPITYRQSLSGIPETGWWMQQDGGGQKATKFLSLFNLIDNKYSSTLFGMPRDGSAEVWEVEDNNFTFTEELPEGQWTDNKWVDTATELYYSRVPKKSGGRDYGKADSAETVAAALNESRLLRRFHNWIVSINPNVATRHKTRTGDYATLTPPVTIGPNTYTKDSVEYRIAKFRAEYPQYLNKWNAIFYLNFCDWILGVDSMCKNMSIVFPDTSVENPQAEFFLRDTDTQKRYNNSGLKTFQSYHEWNDAYTNGETEELGAETYDSGEDKFTEGGLSPVYNGARSGLWDMVNLAWADDRATLYGYMKSSGLSAQGMKEMYDSFRDQWCEALYNVDAMGYANTARFSMAHGDKKESFYDFYKSRERYMDSKFRQSAASDALVIRLYGSGRGVALRHYCPIYATVNFGAGGVLHKRSLAPGEPVYFLNQSAFNDTTFQIYDPELLTSINTASGDESSPTETEGVQGIAAGGVFVNDSIGKCKRLESFVMDCSQQQNTRQTGEVLGVGNSVALRKLVIRNCPNVTGELAVKSKVIHEIDLRGTGVNSVTIPPTSSLEILRLPAVQTLKLNGLSGLSTSGENAMSLASYANLTDLELQGWGTNFDARGWLLNTVFPNAAQLARTVIKGVNWYGISLAQLGALLDHNTDFTGVIQIEPTANVDFATKVRMINAWGNTDADNGARKVTHSQVEVTRVSITGSRAITSAGTYQMGLQGEPLTGNDICGVRWEVEGPTKYGISVDSRLGTVQQTAAGASAAETDYTAYKEGNASEAPAVTLRATVTKINGTELTATATLQLYQRDAKVGDYVYINGSYSDYYDASKTLVGICYYVDPNDPSRRMCVCAYPQRVYAISSSPWGLTSELSLASNKSTLNVQGLTGWGAINGASDANMRQGDDIDPDGFRVWAKGNASGTPTVGTAEGRVGFVQLTDTEATAINELPSYHRNNKSYTAGEWVPYALYSTLMIIRHRNMVLTDSNISLPVPANQAGGENEFTNLSNCITSAATALGTSVSGAQQYYFAAASYCHAFEPSPQKDGEVIAECFKRHNWSLPCAGDMLRLMWYRRQGTTPGAPNAIFADAIGLNGLNVDISGNIWTAEPSTSLQGAWCGSFSSWGMTHGGRNGTDAVRAVAAF